MSFKPGQSGNPKGRTPGVASYAEQIRSHKDAPKLINSLFRDAIKSKTARDRIAASKVLLEWGWSKPPQGVVGDPAHPIEHRVTFGGRYKPTNGHA